MGHFQKRQQRRAEQHTLTVIDNGTKRRNREVSQIANQAAGRRRNGPDGYILLGGGTPRPRPRVSDRKRAHLFSTGESAA